MGGHGGGDLASRAVVAALATLDDADSAARASCAIRGAASSASTRICARLRSRSARRRSSARRSSRVLIFGAHFACVWCGDSRAYLLRDGALDADLARPFRSAGPHRPRRARAATRPSRWPRRNVVTRALGATDRAALDIVDGPSIAGDRFLLCSDGLTKHVEDAEIAALLAARRSAKGLRRLIALTLQRGAQRQCFDRHRRLRRRDHTRAADRRCGCAPAIAARRRRSAPSRRREGAPGSPRSAARDGRSRRRRGGVEAPRGRLAASPRALARRRRPCDFGSQMRHRIDRRRGRDNIRNADAAPSTGRYCRRAR